MTKPKTFLFFCLAFLAGVFFGSLAGVSVVLALVIALAGVLFVSVFWQHKKWTAAGGCLIFLALGFWRYDVYWSKIASNPLKDIAQQEKVATLAGLVAREPIIGEGSTRLTLKTEGFGLLQIKTGRYPEYQYGDTLVVSAVVELPNKPSDINGLMNWPKIEVLARGQGNPVFAGLLFFKQKLKQSFWQNLSPPQGPLLAGIILGDERQIPQIWKDRLNTSGIRHITSVSGMHIVILSEVLMWIGLAVGLWRGQAFYFAVIMLAIFIIMIGAPAPAVRAGIMGGLLLLAQKVGRLASSSRALVIAASLMVYQNPLLLLGDIGFQLSFLATLGIIYLGPIFQGWFSRLRLPKFLGELLSMTFSAQVFTLPILIYNFGYFSLVASLANLLIVPSIAPIMAAGFLLGFVGMCWQALAWIFSLPAWLLLTYLLKVAEYSSKIPFSALTLKISWPFLLLAYAVIAALTFWLQRRAKSRFLNY